MRICLSRADKKGQEIARARAHIESRMLPAPEEFDLVLGNDGKLRYQSASMTDEQAEAVDALRRLARI